MTTVKLSMMEVVPSSKLVLDVCTECNGHINTSLNSRRKMPINTAKIINVTTHFISVQRRSSK